MKQVATRDPDILHFKSGGGPLVVPGVPFLCAGLFMLAVSLGLVPLRETPPPWYVALPIGLGLCVAGLVMIFGRTELLIDRRQKRIVRRLFFLVPLRTREFILGDYRRIAIGKEIKKNQNGTHTVYPVRLEGGEEVQPINIDEPVNYEDARQRAEALAHHLDLPVVDTSTGTPILRDAAALDETLRERLRKKGGPGSLPRAPVFMKASVKEETDSLTVVIPPAGMGMNAWVALVPTLIFGIVVAVFFGEALGDLPLPPPIRVTLTAFAVMFFVAVPLLVRLRAVMARNREETAVTATPAFLRVEKKAPMKKKTIEEIPAEEIEELFVKGVAVTDLPGARLQKEETGTQGYTPIGPTMRGRSPMRESGHAGAGLALLRAFSRTPASPQGIVVRSDRATLTFGQGLPEEELRYLCAMIEKTLAG